MCHDRYKLVERGLCTFNPQTRKSFEPEVSTGLLAHLLEPLHQVTTPVVGQDFLKPMDQVPSTSQRVCLRREWGLALGLLRKVLWLFKALLSFCMVCTVSFVQNEDWFCHDDGNTVVGHSVRSSAGLLRSSLSACTKTPCAGVVSSDQSDSTALIPGPRSCSSHACAPRGGFAGTFSSLTTSGPTPPIPVCGQFTGVGCATAGDWSEFAAHFRREFGFVTPVTDVSLRLSPCRMPVRHVPCRGGGGGERFNQRS